MAVRRSASFRSCSAQAASRSRELLEYLKRKEPSAYYSDILIPNGKTVRDFMNGGYSVKESVRASPVKKGAQNVFDKIKVQNVVKEKCRE